MGQAYAGKVPVNVLDSCRSLGSATLQQVLKAHPRLSDDLRLTYEQQTADCLAALKGQRPPDRKALAMNEFRIHFQQRLDKEEPLPLAKEIAIKLCSCKQPNPEEWCQEKTATMVELFQEKFGEDRTLMDQVFLQNMPILDSCK